MSNCVPILNKSYADFLLKCKCCKQGFEPLNYKQRFCKNADCKRIRRAAQQRTYRQKKAGIQQELLQ